MTTPKAPLREIELAPRLREQFIAEMTARWPQKSFGYFVAERGSSIPSGFVLFEDNVRNHPDFQPEFHARGQYFVRNDDAGFVASAEEAWRIQKMMWEQGLERVGVFHSHQRHPANFSDVDWQLHRRSMGDGWHVIISLRNRDLPQMRAFEISDEGVREVPWARDPSTEPEEGSEVAGLGLSRIREVLALDERGLPRCDDARLLHWAIVELLRTRDEGTIEELLFAGFLRDREERYHEHVAPTMCRIPRRRFAMGGGSERRPIHFCEGPRHEVEVGPFELGGHTVTNQLYSLLDPRRLDLPESDRRLPVTGLTWFEAWVFALWVGCRLPTEAEWELACGGGADAEWCCEEEAELARYAWYSESSEGRVHEVTTREPNQLGLYDMHGNVWEWCEDVYDADFYQRSPEADPVSRGDSDRTASQSADRVVRGGSMWALAEMCRTRYRFHESADFHSVDLGCRLARRDGERLLHEETDNE